MSRSSTTDVSHLSALFSKANAPAGERQPRVTAPNSARSRAPCWSSSGAASGRELRISGQLHRIARHGQPADVDDQLTRCCLLGREGVGDAGHRPAGHAGRAQNLQPAPARTRGERRLDLLLQRVAVVVAKRVGDEQRIGRQVGAVERGRESGEQVVVRRADDQRLVARPEGVERARSRSARCRSAAGPRPTRGTPAPRPPAATPSRRAWRCRPGSPSPRSRRGRVARPRSAARMAPKAYSPADRSLMGSPGLVGSPSGAPVIDMSPLVPCTTES